MPGVEFNQVPHALFQGHRFPPSLEGKNPFDEIFAQAGIVWPGELVQAGGQWAAKPGCGPPFSDICWWKFCWMPP